MTYFKNITSYEELKKQYRILATTNHPDVGGTTEAMQAINSEYDMLFPVWKIKNKITTTETAYSTRSEFYTQNGWKGENHDINQSLKEIATLIRAYVKELYPTYKFSVTTSYASMCQELHIAMMESPCEIYKKHEEWTDEDKHNFINKAYRANWNEEEQEKQQAIAFYNDRTVAVIEDINKQVNSYNRDDSDSMIDYFNIKFYYFGCQLGKWDKPIRVVKKQERLKNTASPIERDDTALTDGENTIQPYTYDIKQDVDTRDNSTIFVVKIIEKLSKEEYINALSYMKSVGSKGYSRYKHGFLFTDNPTEVLSGAATEFKQSA